MGAILMLVVLIFAALIAYVDWSSKKDAEKREAEKLAEYTEFVWPTSDLALMTVKIVLLLNLLKLIKLDIRHMLKRVKLQVSLLIIVQAIHCTLQMMPLEIIYM